MLQTILGTKLNQTQKYTKEGVRIPITEILANPSVVVQVKSKEKDGYLALKLGWGQRRDKTITKPVLGLLKKAGITKSPRFLREIRLTEAENYKPGDQIIAQDILKVGDLVNVIGVSKGKGFAGVVKRWGFRGGPKTHGQSDRERAPGSIGSTTTPGRVYKGKKMAGRMGGERVTLRNLQVVNIDPEKNILSVYGLVPGSRGGLLIVEKVGQAKRAMTIAGSQTDKEQEVIAEPLQPEKSVQSEEEITQETESSPTAVEENSEDAEKQEVKNG